MKFLENFKINLWFIIYFQFCAKFTFLSIINANSNIIYDY